MNQIVCDFCKDIIPSGNKYFIITLIEDIRRSDRDNFYDVESFESIEKHCCKYCFKYYKRLA